MYATNLELQIGFAILIVLLILSIILFSFGIAETVDSVDARNKYREANRKWLIEGTSCPAGYRRVPNTETPDKNTGLTKFMCELIAYKEPDTKYTMMIAGSILTGVLFGASITFGYMYWDRMTSNIDIGDLNNQYLKRVGELEKNRSDLGRLYQTYGNNLDRNIGKSIIPEKDRNVNDKILTADDIRSNATELRQRVNDQIKELHGFAKLHDIDIHDPKRYIAVDEFLTRDVV